MTANEGRDPVKIGITGLGTLGRLLGEEVRNDYRASLTGIADLDSDRLTSVGEKLGIEPSSRYDGYESILEDATLDAVVLVTPHSLHYEQIVMAMDRDLHILCEKPLTTDTDLARDLVRRDESREETTMVGYQRHHQQPYVEARRLLEVGSDLKLVTAEITQPWIDRFEDTWRTDPDLNGGGQLYDTGGHLIDAVLWLTALTPVSVSAEMEFHGDKQAVDKQALLTVRFENDAVANITISGDTPCVQESITVWSADGGLRIEGEGWGERSMEYIDSDDNCATEQVELDPSKSVGKIEAFLNAICTDSDPPTTVRDAYEVTAVTEAAYRSARKKGKRVEVNLERFS